MSLLLSVLPAVSIPRPPGASAEFKVTGGAGPAHHGQDVAVFETDIVHAAAVDFCYYAGRLHTFIEYQDGIGDIINSGRIGQGPCQPVEIPLK